MPSFIIEEVIKDLVDNKTPLESALLKLQYFAEITSNRELLNYVHSELNGYAVKIDIPDYRKAVSIIQVDFQFGEIQHNNNILPVELLTQEAKEAFKYFRLHEPVSVLEQMRPSNENENDSSQHLVTTLPMTLIHLFQKPTESLYKNPYYKAEVFAVRLLANRNIILSALTTIRSKLLSFCIQIGKTFGYKIEIESFNKSNSSNNEKIVHIMNTTINNQGDGNVINTGDNSSISASISIEKGNKSQLNSKLKELGIDSDDIIELNELIDVEAPDLEKKKLGNKTVDWISKVSGKALKGVGNITKEVTSSVLAHIIMQYFGIPPLH